MPTTEQRRAALAYIHRIRNSRKQAYANLFHMHLLNGTEAPSTTFGLSLMARQAVEMRLREILDIRAVTPL